ARAHGLADKGCLGHADLLHEARQKFREHPAVVDRHRLVGLSPADLVRRYDAEFSRQPVDRWHPARALPARAVQQDHRRAASSFEVMQLVAKDGCVLRHGLDLLRYGGRLEQQQRRDDENGCPDHLCPPLLRSPWRLDQPVALRFWPSLILAKPRPYAKNGLITSVMPDRQRSTRPAPRHLRPGKNVA